MRSARWFLVLLALRGISSAAEPDTDGDGLSDYAEVHKYCTDPHRANSAGTSKPDGDWDQRKEFTYTITSVLRLAKPYRLADMNDDYQDARVLAEDADSVTVEVVYYPLNTNRFAIGENPNWKRDYAGMTGYLRPTPTENWDEKMCADLIAQLARDGIEPEQLTDRQLVTEVSQWLMKRSRSTSAFAVWYVHFPGGRPEVFPSLRQPFDREKPTPEWTDQAMFDQEVLGRSMFYQRVHGSCTSTAVYIATVMRALGIPTRIVFTVPALDANDGEQRQMMLAALHHNRVRATIRHGLPDGHGSFTNHVFNEVFVGNRWVRLNYDVLGQNILDDRYFGLLTHILTADSLSDVPLPQTWGLRYARYAEAAPKLSSINPYQLLKVSDHFGANAHVLNPEVENEELRHVTITETYWRDELPAPVRPKKWPATNSPDFWIGIQEYIPGFRLQLREFSQHAAKDFILSAPGRPEVHARLMGWTITSSDGRGRFQLFGVRINAEDRGRLVQDAEYRIRPVQTGGSYTWTVKEGLVLKAGPLRD